MAEVEKALVSILRADADVAALVASRVYFAEAPQSPPIPFVLLTRINTDHVHSLNGPSGLANARIQVDCYAKTQKEARSVANTVRKAIDGFRGIESEVFVQGVILLDTADGYDEPPELRRVMQDFHVWYTEE